MPPHPGPKLWGFIWKAGPWPDTKNNIWGGSGSDLGQFKQESEKSRGQREIAAEPWGAHREARRSQVMVFAASARASHPLGPPSRAGGHPRNAGCTFHTL